MPASSSLERLEARLCAIAPDRAQGAAWEDAVCGWINAKGCEDWTRAWRWNDWPERARLGLKGDKGVDLVAETHDGAHVAIQVKFRRDPDDPVTAPEVQKLVGSYRRHFRHFALVSNARRVSGGVAEAVGPTDAMIVLREHLEATPYDWAEARALPRVPLTPLAFQLQAAEDIRAALADGGRAQIVMACGTGKTLTMLVAMEALDAERVLVLAPTLLLVKQLRDAWVANRREDRPWASLAVCSDLGGGEDEVDLSPAELGAPVTTDPGRIAAFLRLQGRRVVFGTYASSDRIAKAQELPEVPAFDLALADEAHRIAGVVAARSAGERSQRVVLDEHRIRAKRRLFATATPRVTSGARARDGEEVLLESMDDEARFGRVVHSVTFQQAVELGRLVPYKLIVTVVTEAEVAAAIRERAFVDMDGEAVPADTLASGIALRRAFDELGISRIISYHARVEGARAFAALLPRVPGPGAALRAEHVAGTMPVPLRTAVLARLAEATAPTVVTNARCLTEGIDVPALDAVAFIDPRRSQVDIVQAVGRAMRKPAQGSAKTTGYILLPVYLTDAQLADPEAAVEGSAFERVLRVLRALKDHDPLMARFVAKTLVAAGERPLPRGEGIDEVLEVRLGQALDKVLAERLVEAVRLRAVEVAADPFERNLELLRRFVERERHARVPAAHVESGIRLGSWVNAMRTARRTLSPIRKARLDTVGFVWNARESVFDMNLSALHSFVRREGHARVPRDHDEAGVPLGRWVRKTRSRHDKIASQRRILLDALGFVWDAYEDQFERNFALLRQFVQREGHARVPDAWFEGRSALGSWVGTVRGARIALSPEQVTRLNELGFDWNPFETTWQRNLELLQQFKVREGHVRVPQKHLEAEIPLGAWVSNLRQKHRQGVLSPEMVAALSGVGFQWASRVDSFEQNYSLLLQFLAREGHAEVPTGHVEAGENLGQWAQSIRARRDNLPAERVAQLESIDFKWRLRDARFERNFNLLVEFVETNGHAWVPQHYRIDDVNLGHWVGNLRAIRERLPSSEADRLDALGFVWDASTPRAHAARFDDGLAALGRFKSREGHVRVPPDAMEDDFPLGSWVRDIRSQRKSLSLARTSELEGLGIVWHAREDWFERNLSLLRRFVEREGHARVPDDWREEGVALGTWVGSLRQRCESLSVARQAHLNALGFVWAVVADQFQHMVSVFARFVAREHHALVPAVWVEDGEKLGIWVQNIRRRKAALSVASVAQLDELGFVWDPLEQQFQRHLVLLKQFVEVRGHCRVPQGWVEEGVRLGTWVAKLRCKRDELPPDRIAQLDALGFVWSVRGKASAPPPVLDGASPPVQLSADDPHEG